MSSIEIQERGDEKIVASELHKGKFADPKTPDLTTKYWSYSERQEQLKRGNYDNKKTPERLIQKILNK